MEWDKHGNLTLQGHQIDLNYQNINWAGNQVKHVPGGQAAEKPKIPAITFGQRLWISLRYAVESVLPSLQTVSLLNSTNHLSVSATSDTQSNALVYLENNVKYDIVKLDTSLAISLQDRSFSYPRANASLKDNNFVAATAKNLPHETLEAKDKQLSITLLPAPIIKLITQSLAPVLTADEIDYLKANGNNVMLFIHGFNVNIGKFAPSITDLQPKPTLAMETGKLDITYSTAAQTVYCDIPILKRCYPQVKDLLNESDPARQFTDAALNGTESYNWFIHIEDNLNRATNQFQRDDYTKYTRCLHIGWKGNVFVANYLEAEPNADEAGTLLVALLQQLHQAGISINVIAHSLGNRVLLRAMSILALNGITSLIDHAFLWDAAVPATVLSSNARQQLLNKPSDQFLSAANAAKKITVLYSKHDDVLKNAYYLAKDADANQPGNQQDMNVFKALLAEQGNASLNNSAAMYPNSDLAKQRTEDLVEQHRCLQWLNASSSTATIDSQYSHLCRHLHERMQRDGVGNVVTALGYDGLDSQQEDGQIKKLKNENKLFLADMSPYSIGHNYMKIPNAQVMRYGYQTYIINKSRGVAGFGSYIKTNFPDY